jgi:ElaB/YqjD/DUF883 family membrane-anchored ribosome-binding protein
MKTIIAFLKSKRLSQLMVASLSALFLLVNTACAAPSVSAKGAEGDSAKVVLKNPATKVSSPYRKDTNNVPAGQVTEFYDSIQPVEGGMNNYSDVDPRQNTSKADAKAEKLVKGASHSEKKSVNSPVDAVKKELDKEPIPERIQKFSKDIGKSAQKAVDRVSDETQKGTNNLSKNTTSLLDKTQSRAETLAQQAQDKVDDVGSAAKQTSDSVVSKAQEGVDKAQNYVQGKGGAV